jgi:hypothetical protein
MIWLSEKRDFFRQNLPAFSLRKILLLSTSVFRGDYQRREILPEEVTFSDSQRWHRTNPAAPRGTSGFAEVLNRNGQSAQQIAWDFPDPAPSDRHVFLSRH